MGTGSNSGDDKRLFSYSMVRMLLHAFSLLLYLSLTSSFVVSVDSIAANRETRLIKGGKKRFVLPQLLDSVF